MKETVSWFLRLLEDAPDAIVIADHEGRLVFVNRQTERLFGYERAELLGQAVELLLPASFRQGHAAHRRAFLAAPRMRPMGPQGAELCALRKDGTEVPVEISLSPIQTPAGPLTMATVRDATERREHLRREQAARLEAEMLAEAHAELASAAENARAETETANLAKDNFILMLSHELRTPLTPIFLWTGMLRQQPGLTPDQFARALDGIERSARAQSRLIEDLLEVSRIIAGKLHVELQPTCLSEIVTAALETVSPVAKTKHVTFEAAIAAPAQVMGDPHRLAQIVTNLLSNAIKFSHAGGHVTVRVEHVGNEVRLTVRDAGHGIAPAFLKRVFVPFEQADTSTTRAYGGLGLGLTIVRHLVERQGGSVRAESAGLGKGATFTVTFPACHAATVSADSPNGQRRQLDLTGLRILVVDDDPDTANALQALLSECGADTRIALSVSQALAELAQWQANLLISDIAMPGQDGHVLIREIRARGGAKAHLPAIALTAYARTDDRQEALAAGFDDYLAKPVQSRELLAAIAMLVHAPRAA